MIYSFCHCFLFFNHYIFVLYCCCQTDFFVVLFLWSRQVNNLSRFHLKHETFLFSLDSTLHPPVAFFGQCFLLTAALNSLWNNRNLFCLLTYDGNDIFIALLKSIICLCSKKEKAKNFVFTCFCQTQNTLCFKHFHFSEISTYVAWHNSCRLYVK